jgi:hypothetical protein
MACDGQKDLTLTISGHIGVQGDLSQHRSQRAWDDVSNLMGSGS